MYERAEKLFALLIDTAAIVGGLWLFIRFLLPWTAPLLLAFVIAALLEVPVGALTRRGWPRGAAAGLLTLSVLGLIIWAASALSGRLVSLATSFASQVPALAQGLSSMTGRLLSRISQYSAGLPQATAEYLGTAVDAVIVYFNSLPAAVSRKALDIIAKTAQSSPDILLFTVTAGIGSYFLSSSFPTTLAFITAQLPQSLNEKLQYAKANLRGSFGGMIKAQLILSAMSFFQLICSFLLLGIDNAVGAAAITALIDALPVFGTGAVLLPWAAYCLLLGQVRTGTGLCVSWALVTLVRSCAQAKLLGDQIGLDPLVSLLSIYVGFKVWSVWGMLLFPLLAVTAKQLNDRGIVHLWKSLR